MDVLQLALAQPQQPADAPTTGMPVDTPGSGSADDTGVREPLTFKALLARVKTPQLTCADTPSPATSPPALENDSLAVDESAAASSVEPGPALVPPALPFAVLPAAPASASSAGAKVSDVATVIESARAKAAPSKVLVSAQDAAAPQLQEIEIGAQEKSAADFAAHGEHLPPIADGSRRQTTALPKELSAAPSAAPVLQPAFQPVQAAAPTAVSAAPAAIAQISTPVGTADWGNEVGQRMVWMVREKQHVAELHLNPPHLGPLDITLTVDGTQTSAVFTSPHAAVRELMVAELPRLREVLADSGITLGNASVTADTPRDGAAFASQQQQRGTAASASTAAAEFLAPHASAPVMQRIGLVDLFA